jgi:hypothetical protein
MWRLVTIGASRQGSMLAVTESAVYLAVTARCFGPFEEYLLVAGSTGGGSGIGRKDGFQRFMHRVTLEAGSKGLVREMCLVTFETGGNAAVSLTVTIQARLSGMGAGEFLQLFRRLPMAISAASGQLLHRELQPRSMGILMTGKAVHLLLAMGKAVAVPACGHQFGKIVLARIVGVKNLVAIRAVEPVRSSLVLQGPELIQMASATLCHCHRLGIDRIRTRRCGRQEFPAGLHRCIGSARPYEQKQKKGQDLENPSRSGRGSPIHFLVP